MPQLIETNEDLDAIVRGLDISKGDNVLAICGSGDQAFAMAAFGAEVRAVDKDREQLQYAIDAAGLIERGKFRPVSLRSLSRIFFDAGYRMDIRDRIRRHRFFSGHMDQMQENVGNITFVLGDIFRQDASPFNKIYLSNADCADIDGLLDTADKGTLFYICDRRYLHKGHRCLVQVDEVLTEKAGRYQARSLRMYSPQVFSTI